MISRPSRRRLAFSGAGILQIRPKTMLKGPKMFEKVPKRPQKASIKKGHQHAVDSAADEKLSEICNK
jgi:hypothetical protein